MATYIDFECQPDGTFCSYLFIPRVREVQVTVPTLRRYLVRPAMLQNGGISKTVDLRLP